MFIEAAIGSTVTVVLAIVGWAANTHAEVKVLKKGQEDQKELIEVKLDSIDSRLGRIERALNGAWKRTEESSYDTN